ncbi:hypothetical protein PCASD_19214 [Puccinia coronata f. sp. avenae]|uniref:Uncharacterized protein n=1 Tax=Puccinia coronata f. sp. avenae TaxID=200324 RepID=A0A2N5UKE7_9BASI|nr:hypothetical protein PCASD_19214 [Puccinia coronata f. sp. avenae]
MMATSAQRLVAPPPQLYAKLAWNHILAVVVEPPAAYKSNTHKKLPNQHQMSACPNLASVADATLYLADDITVPYYPDQEPKSAWMALRREVVKDFLRQQEV